MQRDISDKNTLGSTLNPINDIRRSIAIDRTTSNYDDAKEKVQKIRELVWENTMQIWSSNSGNVRRHRH